MTVNEMIERLQYIAAIGGGNFPVKVWYTDNNYDVHEQLVEMLGASFVSSGAEEDHTLIFIKK